MKKLVSLFLVLSLAASMAACAKPANHDVDAPGASIAPTASPEASPSPEAEATQTPAKEEKEEAKQTAKPSKTEKPAETQAPTAQPTEKPVEKPTEAPAPKTLGQTLRAEFKSLASSGKSSQAIAEGLMQNPVILFNPVFEDVTPGLLTGFGNTEITGFKSAVKFLPMIGSIAFVGYIFELDSTADTSAFVANLKSNANPRWNICTEAEETVTEVVGNKVFFLMCPTTIEE